MSSAIGPCRRRFVSSGFRVIGSDRQFVLPIALHKAIGSLAVTSRVEGAARTAWPSLDAGIAGHARGGALRVLVTGATGFTGGHLARALASAGLRRSCVRARSGTGGRRSPASPGIEPAVGDLEDRASLDRAVRGVDVVYHIAAIYRQAGLPDARLPRGQCDGRAVGDRGGRRAPARGASCTAARSACTGTSSIRLPTRTLRFRPGDVYQETKVEGEAVARAAGRATGLEVVIARPTGIYGPGDRRLLKLFRGVARRRFVVLGSGEIYYHLTYIDDLVDGFRLCGESPAAAGRTYILAGGEVTTLNELVALIAAEAGVRAAASCIFRCGRSGPPGRL